MSFSKIFTGSIIFLFTFLFFSCGGKQYNGASGITLNAPGNAFIKGDIDYAEIPFELYGMNILIHAEMNNKKIKLLIDNGSLWDQVWFFNGEVDSINLYYKNDIIGEVVGEGEDGGSAIREGTMADIKLENVIFTDQPTFISVPEAGYDKLFPGVNGQISSMIFKHFIVGFDFDRMLMTLTKPGKFVHQGNFHPIPMSEVDFDSYTAPIRLGMQNGHEVEMDIVLDIGTIAPLYLRTNKELGISIPENTKKKLYGYGASGAIYSHHGSVHWINIGEHTLYNVPVEFEANNTSPDSSNEKTGLLGLPLMMMFDITFDYFNGLLYLEPNESFNKAFEN